jgi:pseudoazurin
MKYIVISIISLFLTFTASTKEVVIEMLNKRDDGQKMVYSQDVANIDIGDSIKWVPSDKGHNVEFVGGPDGATLPARSGLNKEVSITFDKPGIYLYVCTPHKVMGMIALVIVGEDLTNKDTIAKIKMLGRGKKKLASLISKL